MSSVSIVRQRATYVVLEGGEGSGKTTILDRLRETEAVKSERIFITREPGGSDLGEDEIRRILFSEKGKKFVPLTQFNLFQANRSDVYAQVILPRICSGQHVLSDRGAASTFAHQIFGEGHHELRALFREQELALRQILPVPPVYLYLDVDPAEGLERKKKAADGNFFDNKGIDYHRRVQKGYYEFASFNRVVTIDANRPLQEVWIDFCRNLERALS